MPPELPLYTGREIGGRSVLRRYRVRPVGVRPHVDQHPHVVGVLPPYGEAEAVLVLASSLVEVALRQDVAVRIYRGARYTVELSAPKSYSRTS